jgi:hypothetical protein
VNPTPEQLAGLTEELIPLPTAEQLDAIKRELGHPANWCHEWNTIAPMVRAQALEEAAKLIEDGNTWAARMSLPASIRALK